MYEHGLGVIQSYKEALVWYRKAADQGDAHAQCNLGVMYLKGQGVVQSYKDAVLWYRKAANQGDAQQAQFLLGLAYEECHGVPKSAARGPNN
mmetsp:Transcript_61816/g.139918  ORF Transcript_61816/g.139918 Transcript_61816/m.139918 type:complete len:92 (+) Transcript_61816:179-454(+)